MKYACLPLVREAQFQSVFAANESEEDLPLVVEEVFEVLLVLVTDGGELDGV